MDLLGESQTGGPAEEMPESPPSESAQRGAPGLVTWDLGFCTLKGVYRGYIGIMEKKMKTTMRVSALNSHNVTASTFDGLPRLLGQFPSLVAQGLGCRV